MQDNRDQFSMFGAMSLPDGSTIAEVAELLRAVILAHDALRTRLIDDQAGRPRQEVAGSGELDLQVVPLPRTADQVDRARYLEHLIATWPLAAFDFERDWPLRVAVLTQAGTCSHLVWVLSHLAADGAANLLLLRDLANGKPAGRTASEPRPVQLLELARQEQAPPLRQLSNRTMRYWETQLGNLPALTFGRPADPAARVGHRYWQVRFSSPAAHLAIAAIARRTGTDLSRVTLAIVAIAIGRVTGAHPLPVSVMVSNRFRPGLAEVFAPIAQNSLVVVDAAQACVDDVVAQVRSASLTAGLRAYYDPDELAAVFARSAAADGAAARISCRFNDQRAMSKAGAADQYLGEASAAQLAKQLGQTSLSWHHPLDQLHDALSIVITNRPEVLSVYLKCDLWCLSPAQVEAILAAVERVAVEAAFDPAAPTGVRSV